MKGGWRIGRVSGIDIYLHSTFLILLAWVAISSYLRRHSWIDEWNGLAFTVVLFGVVVLHELGHSLTARRYGIRTRDITLLPIGGVARLERMPEVPKQELLVALAGPAVNLVIATIILLIYVLVGKLPPLERISFTEGQFGAKLLSVNLFLAGFNLLPAFPMDGGRVLRAVLAMKMDYVHATQKAASIGQAMALVFALIGLLSNPFLVIIAVFVWMGAAQEASMVQMKTALGGIPISVAMIREFHTLSSQETLQRAIDLLMAGFQQDFPVVDDGQLVGVLTRAKLLKVLASQGQEATVGDAMERTFQTAEPSEMIESVFARLQACECHTLPVIQSGHLKGILTMDNIGEFLMLQSALRKAKA